MSASSHDRSWWPQAVEIAHRQPCFIGVESPYCLTRARVSIRHPSLHCLAWAVGDDVADALAVLWAQAVPDALAKAQHDAEVWGCARSSALAQALREVVAAKEKEDTKLSQRKTVAATATAAWEAAEADMRLRAERQKAAKDAISTPEVEAARARLRQAQAAHLGALRDLRRAEDDLLAGAGLLLTKPDETTRALAGRTKVGVAVLGSWDNAGVILQAKKAAPRALRLAYERACRSVVRRSYESDSASLALTALLEPHLSAQPPSNPT